MLKKITLTVLIGFLAACGGEEKKEESKKESNKEETTNASLDYSQIGKSVTNTAQSTLLKHVGAAMKMGGPQAAIQYCNINAMSITDSLSKVHDVKISRVAEKNRNKNNLLADADLSIWDHYKSGEQNVQMADTVIDVNGKMVYYRPIYIANPACLNCHGQEGTDIMDATIAKLDELYPEDKARNYNLGDLRGMWKLEFSK